MRGGHKKYEHAANLLKTRNAIVKFMEEEGRVPTCYEIMALTKLGYGAAYRCMHFIEVKGWVEDFFVRPTGMHAPAPNPTIMDERWAQ